MRMNSLLCLALLTGLSVLGITLAHRAWANTANQPSQADSDCYWVSQSGQTIDLTKICDRGSRGTSTQQAANPLQPIQHEPGKPTPSAMWNLVPDAESPIAGKTYSPTTADSGDQASVPPIAGKLK
jgi:hypothetical protein